MNQITGQKSILCNVPFKLSVFKGFGYTLFKERVQGSYHFYSSRNKFEILLAKRVLCFFQAKVVLP